eukprot:scaffold7325_cov80-Skeletonema_marinoi.AAC.12
MDEGTSKSSAAVASDGCRVLPSRNDAHDDDMQLSRKQRRVLVEASAVVVLNDHISNITIFSRDVLPDALQKSQKILYAEIRRICQI